ncbi:MAG: CotH kinase family protein, partial [Deltaproteobacteria bacterium]|nr:CotH kinase family protein [Deltaproteobacteria bacterium]
MRLLLISCSMSVLLACSGKVSSGGQCRDGKLDAGEDGDGADLGGNDCTSLGFTGGTLACRADCTFNDSACQSVFCGDGVAQGLEQCDGADLRGETCVSAGYSGGALACTGACRMDFSACTGLGPQCGNGNVEGLEECDGANMNGATCQNLGYGAGPLTCRIDCTLEPSACSNIAADPLSDATGCAGVYNIDQVLNYYLTLPAADWSAIKADDPEDNVEVVKGAEFSCEGETPIVVGVRRKRAGGDNKIGVKIDVNYFVANQTHYGLKNLVFDNSVGCCVADDGDLAAIIREYTAWRMMRFGGVVSSRTVFANLYVNNELLGVYINVERVDKVFL